MSYRIYFVGAHGNGKTTLARYVSEKYQLPFLPEMARIILAEKELQVDSLRTNLNVVNEYQTEILTRQISEEKLHHNFVSDRSFDCLAYAGQHSSVLRKLLETPELADYIQSLRKPDVRIFFVRPCKATQKSDGVRESLNWDGVVAIDSNVKWMLEMWDLPHFQINTENMQERVRLVDSVLSLTA